ncbi:MAG: DUF4369 domain-containing protein [Bacteroidales bacterium]
MKTNYFSLFLIFLFFSCNREKEADRFTIQGQFSNSRREKIVLCEMDLKEVIPLDSSNIGNDGTINFSHKTDQPGFYLLTFPGGRRIVLLMKRGENLLLKGDMKEPSSDFTISGSEGSELLEGFFHATLKNKIRIDSIKRTLRSKEGSEDFLRFSMTADSLFFRISGDQKKLEKDFIDRNPQSLASLIVLNYSFGSKPVLTMEEDLSYYQKLTGLYTIYPKNKHVLFHLARLRLFMNNLKNSIN